MVSRNQLGKKLGKLPKPNPGGPRVVLDASRNTGLIGKGHRLPFLLAVRQQRFSDCALQYSNLILPPMTGKRSLANKDPVQLRVALPAANPPDNPATKPFSSLAIVWA